MRLTHEQARAIVDHARSEAPNEACGVIAGRGTVTHEVIPIANVADDQQHTYVMDEQSLVTTLISIEKRGLELVGFYHSHPNSDPIPSPTDIRQATYPATPYLIVSLKGSEARLSAWLMRYGQVTPVEVYVGVESPPESRSLSTAQKIAILLSALIAFILMIVLSLSLLPPAPIIPR